MLKAYRSVDCIQVLSRKDIEIVKEFCGNIEVVYIPNTVDMPDKIIKTKNCNKIINIGRIDGDHKRQLILINAFNKIKEYFLNGNWKFGVAHIRKNKINIKMK